MPGKVRFSMDLRAKHSLGQMSQQNLLQAQEHQQHLYNRGTQLSQFPYLQSPMKNGFSFSTSYGLYQFKTLLFGLFGIQATFRLRMDLVLLPYAEYAAAKVDDVTIPSDTWQQHFQCVVGVLGPQRQAGLTATPKKVQLDRGQVSGGTVSGVQFRWFQIKKLVRASLGSFD